MLLVQKMKLGRDSEELLYVECAYPAQGVLIEGTCFKFERLQETSIEGARKTLEILLKTLKGQVPLRLIKLKALRET